MRRHALALAASLSLACAPRDAAPGDALPGDAMPPSMKAIADRYRAAEPSAATGPDLSAIPGMADYEDAKVAVGAGDLPRAIASFHRAIAANDDCAEYWYNLGAAQSNLAIETVNSSESEAVRTFADGVDSKKRALELMRSGHFEFYGPAEQQQVLHDAQEGLAGVDQILADPHVLVAALRFHAEARGR